MQVEVPEAGPCEAVEGVQEEAQEGRQEVGGFPVIEVAEEPVEVGVEGAVLVQVEVEVQHEEAIQTLPGPVDFGAGAHENYVWYLALINPSIKCFHYRLCDFGLSSRVVIIRSRKRDGQR